MRVNVALGHELLLDSLLSCRCQLQEQGQGLRYHNRFIEELDTLPEDLLEDVVEIFRMLSDATRAQLVYHLTRREYNVNELAEFVQVSSSAVSHHLAKLRANKLVRTRREGSHIYYHIDDKHVVALFVEALCHLDHVRNRGLDRAVETREGVS